MIIYHDMTSVTYSWWALEGLWLAHIRVTYGLRIRRHIQRTSPLNVQHHDGWVTRLLIGKWFIQLSMRTGCIVFKTTGEEFPLFITISWVIYHHHNPASPFLFINITIVFVPSSFGGVLTMCQVLYMKRNCLLHLINLVNGEGNGTLLQYSCLENPMDGGAW